MDDGLRGRWMLTAKKLDVFCNRQSINHKERLNDLKKHMTKNIIVAENSGASKPLVSAGGASLNDLTLPVF